MKDALDKLNKKDGLKWNDYFVHLKTIIDAMRSKSFQYQKISELKEFHSYVKHKLDSIDPIYHLPILSHESSLNREDIVWENINRICFRGDSRDPQDLFKKGFSSNTSNVSGPVIIMPFASVPPAGVIPVSTRFTGATLFPMNLDAETSWIYVVKIKKGVNVHGYSVTSTACLSQKDAEKMFVQEIITNHIAPENIIAAVKIKRWPRKDYPYDDLFKEIYKQCFGNYKILNYEMNPNCTLPEAEKNLVINFIKKEMAANKHDKFIPTPQSGYSLNSLFKPQSSPLANKNELVQRETPTKRM